MGSTQRFVSVLHKISTSTAFGLSFLPFCSSRRRRDQSRAQNTLAAPWELPPQLLSLFPQRRPKNAGADGEGKHCFHRFMKRGGCKDEFEALECVEEADAAGTDSSKQCRDATAALKKCMDAHADHYEPILRADPPAKQGSVAVAAEPGKAVDWERNLSIMKRGRCKEELVAWDKCVHEAEAAGADSVAELCRGVTAAIRKCVDAEAGYYESLLSALHAVERELNAAWARREASGSESSSPEPPLVPVSSSAG